MLIDGEKYACEACVRGHRVSNCQHSGKSRSSAHTTADLPLAPLRRLAASGGACCGRPPLVSRACALDRKPDSR